jgi:hypothetical protein
VLGRKEDDPLPLVIRKLDTTDPGAVFVEGIGALVMAPDGVLVPPEVAVLTDELLRRIYATLPPGYVIEEAEPDVPDGPAPAEAPTPAVKRSKGAQAVPEPPDADPDPTPTTAPEGAPTTDGGDS